MMMTNSVNKWMIGTIFFFSGATITLYNSVDFYVVSFDQLFFYSVVTIYGCSKIGNLK